MGMPRRPEAMSNVACAPRQAIIAVTYRCNARCRMCDIWQRDFVSEVEPGFYEHLPRSLHEVNLSGGEPVLRTDLVDIVAVIARRLPEARIIVSTNGLLTERLARLAQELRCLIPRLGVRVSIDGVGAVHDRIRGFKGAYEQAWASIRALRKAGIVDLGIAFTMVSGNEDQLLPLYDRAATMGLEFTSTVAHSSPIYFGPQADARPDPASAGVAYEELRRRQLSSMQVKNWFRSEFTAGLRDLARGQPRPIDCLAGAAFFFLDPTGTVFPCHLQNWPLGPLDEGYARLLARNTAILGQAARCRANCWMTCVVGPLMRRQLPSITMRVFVARVRALLGSY